MNFLLGMVMIGIGWWNLTVMYEPGNQFWVLNAIVGGASIGWGVSMMMRGDDY